ncbi:MAG: hypothetical protein KF795_24925 [Labilithrix sp.]|nr:hypothetical protein [Labilithrix sp.]
MTIGTMSGPHATAAIASTSMMENDSAVAEASGELLPTPFAVVAYDDLLTSLAVMMLRQKHEQRVTSDQQAVAAAKAQEEAHGRKIEKMRDLADHTFTQALVEGALEGAGAVAAGSSAICRFSGETKDAAAKAFDAKVEAGMTGDLSMADFAQKAELSKASRELVRDANLLDAASKGFAATSKLGGGFARRDQDLDREAMAVADADIDRAKGSVDTASSASRRAVDDIRDTIGAIRQYLAAKTQLANAALIRG